jgi:uncharacterized protein
VNPLDAFQRAFSGAAKTLATRTDGWMNTITGLGTSADKRMAAAITGVVPLQPLELEALFASDDLAAKIVESLPKAALRGGIPVDQDEEGKIADALARWEVSTLLREADTWGRLYGSGYILIGARGLMNQPLGDLPPGGLLYLEALEREDLTVHSRYRDPRKKDFGKPEFYRIQRPESGGQFKINPGELIHESRLIHFGGVTTPRRIKIHNDGHDLGVLQRPYEILRDTNSAWSNVMILFQDLSQAVFKVKGLIEMIANGQKNALQDRMEIVNMARSVARAVMVDAELEDFSHVGAANVTGVDQLLTRVFQRLAAAADMPVTVLLGISPAGLNATGESDIRQWYDQIQTHQTEILTPRAVRLIKIVLQHEGITLDGDPSITWPSLWQFSPMEEADHRMKIAASDKTYIDAGVVQPEAVALARWGGGSYSAGRLEEILDFDALEAALENAVDDLLDPPEPPAVAPNAPVQGTEPAVPEGEEPPPEDPDA